MSETESPYFPGRGLMDLLLPPIRTPEEVNTAYLDLFSTPTGQLVLEDLFRELCLGQSVAGCEAREQGKHDAFLMIQFKMQQGSVMRRLSDGWITHGGRGALMDAPETTTVHAGLALDQHVYSTLHKAGWFPHGPEKVKKYSSRAGDVMTLIDDMTFLSREEITTTITRTKHDGWRVRIDSTGDWYCEARGRTMSEAYCLAFIQEQES